MDQSTCRKLKNVVSGWAIENSHEMAIYLFEPLLKDDSERTINLAIIFRRNIPVNHLRLLWADFHQQWQKELSEKLGEPILLHRCISSLDPGLEKHIKEKGKLIF